MARRGFFQLWLHRLAFAGFLALTASMLYVFWLPDVAALRRSNPRTTAYIELRERQAARAGKKFKKTMVWVPLSQISENLRNAVLTAEDDMFYRHKGVDWEAARVALQKDWEAKAFKYGASTITQQVARNLYLSPSKNPLRKIKELLITYRLEKTLGKRRILEIYLNIAEWGKGVYGAEAAARAYFGKSASELTIDEAVALAVVLPNPRRWKPVGASRYVARNSQRILRRMRASGLAPEEEPAPEEYEDAELGEPGNPALLDGGLTKPAE